MTTISKSEMRLVAKVKARNLVNQYAQEVGPMVAKALTPFIGRKVKLATGKLTKQAKEAMAGSTHVTNELSWYITSSYALYLECKACVAVGDFGCVYEQTSFFLGELDGQILKSMEPDANVRRTDYTVEEIQRIRRELETAKEAVRGLESSLSGFGEYDN